MAAPVRAQFGNQSCRSAQMSLTAGITPDVGTLVMPITASPPAKGTLLLQDGIGGTVTMPDVYLVEGSERELPGGKEISVQVSDRRLLWQWDDISFVWNTRNPDGTDNPERSLHDLLMDLINHLPGAVLGNLPAMEAIWRTPPAAWDMQNTAQALQALCDEWGLIVSMSATGQVSVSQLEQDPAWPVGSFKEKSLSTRSPQKPGQIIVAGAPIIAEHTFTGLVRVGLEANGDVRPVDDLSYKPAGGWTGEPVPTFPNVTAGTYGGVAYTVEEARELAKKCIWKWYALALTANERKQYLPLLDIRSEIVTVDGNDEHGKPYVRSNNAQWDGTQWKKDAQGRISTGFSIDNVLGIVKFDEPVYAILADGPCRGLIVPPTMELRASYEVKADPATPLVEVMTNYVFIRQVPGGVQGTRLVHKVPDLRLYTIDGVEQNRTELDEYASRIAARLAGEFSVAGPESRVYAAIINATPKGTMRSIQWSVDGQNGATTTIQKGFDLPQNPAMPPYEERLRRRNQRVLLESLDHSRGTRAQGERIGYTMGGQF